MRDLLSMRAARPAEVGGITIGRRPARLPINVWRARAAYALILPFGIAWFLFYVLPLIRLVVTSFERAGIKRSTFIGIDNFTALAVDDLFWQDLYNTIVIVVALVPAVMLVALGIALVANELSSRWQSFFRLAFYLPVVASTVVMSVVWASIYRPVGGVLNELLGAVGIQPVVWLGTVETAMPAVIVVLVSFSVGVPLILFLAGLAAIPDELYEAARIDGGSPLQLVRHISLPLLRPTLLFVAVTQTISASQVFALVQILTQGGPVSSTDTLVFLTYRTAFAQFQFGYASAITMVLLVIVSAAAWLQFRLFGEEIQY
jgi:multiple sugar transport system permease protein